MIELIIPDCTEVTRKISELMPYSPNFHVACVVTSRHEGTTLNSRRAASSPVSLVAGDERWETPDPPPGCSLSKLRWKQAKSYCHLYSVQIHG
ncbi:hypothetical protein TNCV_1641511 [Trichonephila clavipes]|nr:hypothetical protein TNCV_1641511 [Trichonephila clavipes]